MKTIKEIADALGINKQRVYRYIRKKRISEAHHYAGVMYYDEAAEKAILKHFAKNNHITEAHQTTSNNTVIDTVVIMLQQELITKNQQIAEQQQTIHELTTALEHTSASLQVAQALHAGTMHKQVTDGSEAQQKSNVPETSPMGFFSRIFGRKKR